VREPVCAAAELTDDMMLGAETPATPLQIQLLLIYDPSTARAAR